MSWRIINTLIAKDMKLFFRDRFFGIMTLASIVMFLVLYFVLPKTVDETIKIGIHAPDAPIPFDTIQQEGGVVIRRMNTEDELKKAVNDKEVYIGISIPGDILRSFASGQKPRVLVYYPSDVPNEINEMHTIFISEYINQISGYKIDVDDAEIILGPDMGGKQIPYRKRLLPLMVLMLLLMETFGLANLMTFELQHGTAHALLTTPMSTGDLFAGKGITGVTLAFSQTFFLLLASGNLSRNTSLIMVTLLLGSIMITGIAFFIAAISKDMMSVVAWGTIVIIVLGIPMMSMIFPGAVSGWIKVIPSFHLADILHRSLNFDIGWPGRLKSLAFISGYGAVFFILGIFALKMKIR